MGRVGTTKARPGTVAFFPSPLVGEGGAKRRIGGLYRGLYPSRDPLTRPSGTLSHMGRGEEDPRRELSSDLLRRFQPRAKRVGVGLRQ